MKQGVAGVITFLMLSRCGAHEPRFMNSIELAIEPFEKLFALQDTVRLDTLAVIGTVSFLDVSREEHLLIADEMSRSTYQFSAVGQALSRTNIGTCQPDRRDVGIRLARFLSSGRIMIVGRGGSVAIIDESGDCAATLVRPGGIESACEIGDSVLIQAVYVPILQRLCCLKQIGGAGYKKDCET